MKRTLLPAALVPCALLATALLALALPDARAQTVALTGVMGARALLVIDGGTPSVLAPGDTRAGVTVVSAGGDTAVIAINGQRQTLRVGESPVRMGAPAGAANGVRVQLTAGSGGHYFGTGQINGASVRFVVDTGASNIVMGVAQAEQLGLDYRAGQREMVSTANGLTQAYRVVLNSVRLGEVEVFNVEGTVVPLGMPVVLLGNSFLGRFQMRQENGLLTLEKRY